MLCLQEVPCSALKYARNATRTVARRWPTSGRFRLSRKPRRRPQMLTDHPRGYARRLASERSFRPTSGTSSPLLPGSRKSKIHCWLSRGEVRPSGGRGVMWIGPPRTPPDVRLRDHACLPRRHHDPRRPPTTETCAEQVPSDIPLKMLHGGIEARGHRCASTSGRSCVSIRTGKDADPARLHAWSQLCGPIMASSSHRGPMGRRGYAGSCFDAVAIDRRCAPAHGC